MSANAAEPSPFGVGCLVRHYHGRIGEVTALGHDGSVTVRFDTGKSEQLSDGAARMQLRGLTQEGFEAIARKDISILREWAMSNPPKLVASVLADLGVGRAIPIREIQRQLESRKVLPSTWKSWWTKNAKIVAGSPHLRTTADRHFILDVSPSVIPENPIHHSQSPIKDAKYSVSVEDAVNAILGGRRRLEEVSDAANQTRIIRHLVGSIDKAPSVEDILLSASESVIHVAGLVLSDLLKSKKISSDLRNKAVIRFLTKAIAPEVQDSELNYRQITAVIEQIPDVILESRDTFLSAFEDDRTSVYNLIHLAIFSLGSTKGLARNSFITAIARILATIVISPPAMSIVVNNLISSSLTSEARSQFVAEIISNSQEEERNIIMIGFLARFSGVDNDVKHRLETRYLPSRDYTRWVSSIIRRELFESKDALLNDVSILMPNNFKSVPSERVPEYLMLSTLLLFSRKANEPLLQSVNAGIKQLLSDKVAGADLRHLGWDAISASFDEHYSSIIVRKEASYEEKIRDLESELEEVTKMLHNAQENVRTLESNFRLPERWVEFQARTELLVPVIGLYQQLFLASDLVNGKQWLISQFENVFHRAGLIKFGEFDDVIEFDLTQHQLQQGLAEPASPVVVMAPGFKSEDPTGKLIIVARALVEGV